MTEAAEAAKRARRRIVVTDFFKNLWIVKAFNNFFDRVSRESENKLDDQGHFTSNGAK